MILINHIIAFIGMFIGSITDLKTREVPDWLNYSLIILGVVSSTIYAFVFSDYVVLIKMACGLLLGIGIGYLMFYAGQWGGGDSKMIMGLGALFGVYLPLSEQYFLKFLINILLVGALYGLLWGIILAVKRWKKFVTELRKEYKLKKIKVIRSICYAIVLLGLISLIFIEPWMRISVLIILAMVVLMMHLWIATRIIERVAMIKEVNPTKLTEGDWIVEDVYIGKKRIVGPKDLGIEKDQIKTLVNAFKKGKIKKIKIKEGIPFVPTFFIAAIVTHYFDIFTFIF